MKLKIRLPEIQINKAITLDHTKGQWVDLGILEEPCITRPETCGAAGAAVSVWLRWTVEQLSNIAGIISSHASHNHRSTHFIIASSFGGLR